MSCWITRTRNIRMRLCLITKIGDRRFLFLLKALSKILHESDIATKALQKHSFTSTDVAATINDLIKSLEKFRSDEEFKKSRKLLRSST